MPETAILPTDAAFAALGKIEQKQLIADLLDHALDHIAAAGREPDDWEIGAFRYAVSCLRLGAISAALPDLKRLVTPGLQRPADRVPVEKSPPAIARLRTELQEMMRDS